MANITISPEFFRSELRNYGAPVMALWRELFQNSIDAGARRIDVTLCNQENSALIGFSDNGRGMSRAVLEDVFFSLGKTTKSGGDSIGGFGKARILLCYAQDSYQIRTGRLSIKGCGAEYEIEETAANLVGCEFRITVPLGGFCRSFEDAERALSSFLVQSQLSAQVTVNGTRWTEWTCRRQAVRRLSFGSVHLNASGGMARRVMVRVNGVLMFARFIDAPVQVIVEIDSAQSREVLLSNRDGLRSEAAQELDEFCLRVSVDTQSALKEDRHCRHILPGRGRCFSPPISQVIEANLNSGEDFGSSTGVEKACLGTVPQPDVTDGMVIVDSSTDVRLKRQVRLFNPASWGTVHGAKRRRLLKQWVVAVEEALAAYCRMKGQCIVFRTGWIFDEEVEAAHELLADGTHALLLNPVLGKDRADLGAGNIRFLLRSWESHSLLVALACHEVAHCQADCHAHNEAFSTLMTDLVAEVISQMREIHMRMMAVA